MRKWSPSPAAAIGCVTVQNPTCRLLPITQNRPKRLPGLQLPGPTILLANEPLKPNQKQRRLANRSAYAHDDDSLPCPVLGAHNWPVIKRTLTVRHPS